MYREGAKPKGTIMPCRGVRGATTTDANTRDEIRAATRQLLTRMIRVNGIKSEDVACAMFTVTRDLNAEFPAFAARQLGWGDVPLLCSYEIDVPGSLPRCIRILANWNTSKLQREITHVYIKGAKKLRPDFSGAPPIDLEPVGSWIADNCISDEGLTV
jgi:chorismate mutase